VSLVLTGAQVATRLAPAAVEWADVLIEGGRIAAVGAPAATDAGRIDCSGCLILPGNVNAHTHAYSALARGMPYRLEPPTTFLEILQRVWWRLDRALDEPSIRASALTAGREALLAGTTTLMDHHASPNAIDGSLHVLAEAFGELGIRTVLAYEVTDRDGEERARAGIEENRRFLQRAAERRYPLARGMVGAHASFTLSADSLDACVELAQRTGTGVHVHVAEDALDEADAVARFDRRVVHRLAAAGALSERSLLAHAVHVDPSEAEVVRRMRATVVHNPRSNMNNAVGRAPVEWLGDRVALGTDGFGADMFEEARTAYLYRREEEVTTSAEWSVARMQEGARVAARAFAEPLLGTLAVGAPADLAVLDLMSPTTVDSANLAAHWIFGLGASHVRDVLVAGEPVVRGGHLVRFDEAEMAAQAREQADRLWERVDAIGPHPFTPSRLLATFTGGR
jgi:putative selenium metabolism protein SsnA